MLRVEIIRAIGLFAPLGEAQAAKLAREAMLVGIDGAAGSASAPLPRGHVVFEAGDPVDGVYFALDLGKAPRPVQVQVEIPMPPPGKPMRFERVGTGAVFGEVEFLKAGMSAEGFAAGGKPGAKARRRDTRAQLLTPASLVRLPISSFAQVLEDNPALRQAVVELSTLRLINALSGQWQGRELDGDARLAGLLLRLAAQFGRQAEDEAEGSDGQANYVVFSQKISQAEIAAELGDSRRTLTERLQAWAEAGLIRTTPLTLLDVRRIEQLARVGREEPDVVIADTAALIDTLLNQGDLHAARALAIDISKSFPSSPQLAFSGALAAARSGRRLDAEAILEAAGLLSAVPGELGQRVLLGLARPEAPVAEKLPEGPDFEDLLGDALSRHADADDALEALKPRAEELTRELLSLRGRLGKDKALATGSAADAGFAAARYLEADRAQRRGDPFPAVNAASLLLLAGEQARAKELAGRVIKQTRPADYWAYSSLAEAQLIAGEGPAALAAARQAMASAKSDGKIASTRRQLRRMAPVLGPAAEAVLEAFSVRRPMVYSGTLILPGQFDDVAAVEAHVAAAVDGFLADDPVGAAYGALAQGSDLLIAEAVLEWGIPLHAVLPFNDVDFVVQSVALGDDPARWTRRFNSVIARAASVTVAQPGAPLTRDLDMSFRHGFRVAGALAAERAAFLETEPLLLAVVAEGAAGNLAGSSADVADWESTGRATVRLTLPFERRRSSGPAQSRHGFAAAVFVFEAPGDTAEPEALLAEALAGLGLDEAKILPRRIKGGRVGAAAILSEVADALALALALHERVGAASRVICDYGPLLGRSGAVDAEALARMAGAGDFAGFPVDRVLAAAPFAAEVMFRRLEAVSVVAAGQRAYRASERGRLRIMPAAGVYELVREEAPAKKTRRPRSQ